MKEKEGREKRGSRKGNFKSTENEEEKGEGKIRK